MNSLKKLYRKIITTEPVVFLDIFKGIVLLGGATGFFVLEDAKYQAISAALGITLSTLLSWLNRSEVYSEKTVRKIEQNAAEQLDGPISN